MSFILDALKKADEARHPTGPSTTGKFRVPRFAPRSARWPWVLSGVALLALNAGLIGYLAWPKKVERIVARPRDPQPARAERTQSPEARLPLPRPSAPASTGERLTASPPARVTAMSPAEPQEPETAAVMEPRRSTRPPAVPDDRPIVPAKSGGSTEPAATSTGRDTRRAPVPALTPRATPPSILPAPQPTAPSLPSAEASGAPPTATAPPPAAAAAPPRPAPMVSPRTSAPTSTAGTIPASPALAASGGGDDELSKLKLTVHVWADQPSERLVFINGRKYVQGDRINDTMILEEITPDGAVVNYQGHLALIRP